VRRLLHLSVASLPGFAPGPCVEARAAGWGSSCERPASVRPEPGNGVTVHDTGLPKPGTQARRRGSQTLVRIIGGQRPLDAGIARHM